VLSDFSLVLHRVAEAGIDRARLLFFSFSPFLCLTRWLCCSVPSAGPSSRSTSTTGERVCGSTSRVAETGIDRAGLCAQQQAVSSCALLLSPQKYTLLLLTVTNVPSSWCCLLKCSVGPRAQTKTRVLDGQVRTSLVSFDFFGPMFPQQQVAGARSVVTLRLPVELMNDHCQHGQRRTSLSRNVQRYLISF
jgi:hypothetical protein